MCTMSDVRYLNSISDKKFLRIKSEWPIFAFDISRGETRLDLVAFVRKGQVQVYRHKIVFIKHTQLARTELSKIFGKRNLHIRTKKTCPFKRWWIKASLGNAFFAKCELPQEWESKPWALIEFMRCGNCSFWEKEAYTPPDDLNHSANLGRIETFWKLCCARPGLFHLYNFCDSWMDVGIHVSIEKFTLYKAEFYLISQ